MVDNTDLAIRGRTAITTVHGLIDNRVVDVEMTVRQDEFCRQYIIDLNGKAAAIRAKYAPKSAAVKAWKMLKTQPIQARVAYLKKESADRAALKVDEILGQWANIATFDIRELVHEDGRMKQLNEISYGAAQAISSLKVRQSKVRTRHVGSEETEDERVVQEIEEIVEVKLWDKHTALTNMANYHGILKNTSSDQALLESFAEVLNNLAPTVGPKDVTPERSKPDLLPEPA